MHLSVALRILSALARWRCDVAIFLILSNKTGIPIAHAWKSISINFYQNRW